MKFSYSGVAVFCVCTERRFGEICRYNKVHRGQEIVLDGGWLISNKPGAEEVYTANELCVARNYDPLVKSQFRAF